MESPSDRSTSSKSPAAAAASNAGAPPPGGFYPSSLLNNRLFPTAPAGLPFGHFPGAYSMAHPALSGFPLATSQADYAAALAALNYSAPTTGGGMWWLNASEHVRRMAALNDYFAAGMQAGFLPSFGTSLPSDVAHASGFDALLQQSLLPSDLHLGKASSSSSTSSASATLSSIAKSSSMNSTAHSSHSVNDLAKSSQHDSSHTSMSPTSTATTTVVNATPVTSTVMTSTSVHRKKSLEHSIQALSNAAALANKAEGGVSSHPESLSAADLFKPDSAGGQSSSTDLQEKTSKDKKASSDSDAESVSSASSVSSESGSDSSDNDDAALREVKAQLKARQKALLEQEKQLKQQQRKALEKKKHRNDKSSSPSQELPSLSTAVSSVSHTAPLSLVTTESALATDLSSPSRSTLATNQSALSPSGSKQSSFANSQSSPTSHSSALSMLASHSAHMSLTASSLLAQAASEINDVAIDLSTKTRVISPKQNQDGRPVDDNAVISSPSGTSKKLVSGTNAVSLLKPALPPPVISKPNFGQSLSLEEQKAKQEELKFLLEAQLKQQQQQLKLARKLAASQKEAIKLPQHPLHSILKQGRGRGGGRGRGRGRGGGRGGRLTVKAMAAARKQQLQHLAHETIQSSSQLSTSEDSASESAGYSTDANASQQSRLSEDGASSPLKRTAEYGSPSLRKRRRILRDEREVRIPLEYGWRRQTKIRALSMSGVRGEVLYFAPCGKKMKTYPEVQRYLDKNSITDISRDNFSFSTKINVGEFLDPQADGQGYLVLNEEEIIARIEEYRARKLRKVGSAKPRGGRRRVSHSWSVRPRLQEGRPAKVQRREEDMRLCKRLAQQRLLEVAHETKRIRDAELRRQKDHIRLMRQQQKFQRQEQLRMEKEMRAQQLIEARRKRMEDVQRKRLAEAMKKAQEREIKRQQAVLLKHQERERRRQLLIMFNMERERRKQHMMLVRALETRKKQEEKERLKAERRAERKLLKESKLEQRRLEILRARELKKPVEDMQLTDAKPVPALDRIPGVKLAGEAFADCMLVTEFLHTFGAAVGLDADRIPSLNTIQLGLLNSPGHTEKLLDLVGFLLHCAIRDPGITVTPETRTVFGSTIREVEVDRDNISEVLKLYLWSRLGRDHWLAGILQNKPFVSLNPTEKAAGIAAICDELLYNRNVSRQIETRLEQMNTMKRDKWVLDGEIRKSRCELARCTAESAAEAAKANRERAANSTPENNNPSQEKKDSAEPKKEEAVNHEDDEEEEEEEEDDSGNDSDGSEGLAADDLDAENDNEKDDEAVVENNASLFTVEDRLATDDSSLFGEGSHLVDESRASTPLSTVTNQSNKEKSDMKKPSNDGKVTEEAPVESEPEDPVKLQKRLDKLCKQQRQLKNKLTTVCHSLRATTFGQDRYKRRYWVLPHAGGVFVEGLESAELDADKLENEKDEVPSEEEEKEEGKENPGKEEIADDECDLPELKPKASIVSDTRLPNGPDVSVKCEKDQELGLGNLSQNKDGHVGLSQSNDDYHSHSLWEKAQINTSLSAKSTNAQELDGAVKSPSAIVFTPAHPLTAEQLLRNLSHHSFHHPWFSVLPRLPCDEASVTRPLPQCMRPFSSSCSLFGMTRATNSAPSGAQSHRGAFPHPHNASVQPENGGVVLPSAAELRAASLQDQNEKVEPVPIEMQRGWWRITDANQLKALMKALHLRGIRERMLLKQLQKNFDYAIASCGKSKKEVDLEITEFDRHVSQKKSRAPSPDPFASWTPDVALRLELDVLWQVERLEDRVMKSSMHVKGFKAQSKVTKEEIEKFVPKVEEAFESSETNTTTSDEKDESLRDVKQEIVENESIKQMDGDRFMEEVSKTVQPTASVHADATAKTNGHISEREDKESLKEQEAVNPVCKSEQWLMETEDCIYGVGGQSELIIDEEAGRNHDKSELSDSELEGMEAELTNHADDSPASHISEEPVKTESLSEEKPRAISFSNAIDTAVHRLHILESAIERRYFKPPLGLRSQLSTSGDKTPPVTTQQENDNNEVSPALASWRRALSLVNSAAQLHMCLKMLDKSIAWEKSIMKVFCQICRRGDNEAELLLCDGCDKGYHTYCFKPKMDSIPDGDWFCYECIAKRTNAVICLVCGRGFGKMAKCQDCSRTYHPECMNPPVTKMPRGRWNCPDCHEKKLAKRGRKSKEMKEREKDWAKIEDDAASQNSFLAPSSECGSTKSVKSSSNKDDLGPCRTILSEMERHECAWPFMLPVDTRQFPQYKKVIKYPMDFQTMRNKLRESVYQNRNEFVEDALLVFTNCETFNEDDSEVGIAGHRMRHFFNNRWLELMGGAA